MNIDKLKSAKKAVKNLELVKRQLEHWESEIEQHTDEFALMDKQVTFDGETLSVGELVNKITSAQDSVNYMTYENNDRMSRQEQREAQSRLNDIIQLAEKAIQEAA